MTGKQTVRGVAAAALVVAMGSAAPAEAAPWPAPALHGGDSASPEAPAESAEGEMDHGDHGMTDGEMDHGDHGMAEGEMDHGTTEGHDHGTGPDETDHSSHGATDGHDDHGTGSDEGHETGHEGGHGEEADAVSDGTKVRVLSGFGAVNAAAVGGAIFLRRRDRRTHRSRTRRADRRGGSVR